MPEPGGIRSALHGLRVLLVDDDDEFLAEMRRQLSAFGAEVLSAGSPAEAVWMLEHAAVDAVICDLVLSQGSGSGLDLLEAVRQRWPAAARVLLTGHGERLASVATSPAAQAVIAKPCEVSRLAELLMHLPAVGTGPADGQVPDVDAPQPGPLRSHVTRPAPGVVHVAWVGDITEDSSFADVDPDAATVIFDLAEVRRVNSVGVHRLSWFLEQLPAAARLSAVRCSPAFVGQLNLVPGLGRRLHVESVYVPLECPQCEAVADALVVLRANGTAPVVPARACSACTSPMEMATPEYLYFAFLSVSPGRGP